MYELPDRDLHLRVNLLALVGNLGQVCSLTWRQLVVSSVAQPNFTCLGVVADSTRLHDPSTDNNRIPSVIDRPMSPTFINPDGAAKELRVPAQQWPERLHVTGDHSVHVNGTGHGRQQVRLVRVDHFTLFFQEV